MAHTNTILVTRLSAMGDVAMTIPVMKQVLADNPGLQIIFVTNKNWGALCAGIPGLTFHPADVKGIHKGVPGLYRLFRELKKAYSITAVADLHNVLRSKILRTFFRLTGTPVAFIDKGRAEKKALTRKEDKILRQLTTTIERYATVFRQLGLRCEMGNKPVFEPRKLPETAQQVLGSRNGKKWIGLAPFATYQEKMYPLDKTEQVLGMLVQDPGVEVLLMGGGKTEVEQLTAMAAKFPGAKVIAGRFSLPEELSIISQLDVMISMDSANMHLASLFGVPVVSVWGATHPYAGFMGYGQGEELAVQVTDLGCRPCSVFGNKPCFRGDHACMQWIQPAQITAKVKEVIS
ncbi:ADP-heptose:LPS heptosyltransferase [Chitinophaga terrae (ex Kim and Jung 2007)]|uniref:ADP-heptose:LPS heptosyltransferase n=1 Tax=Chitinophaga terrae (ex Kim and Jung 2007) TaxID=408074 RepID=A0A1H4A2Y8_9BACT|nr:glycosyltransferase family 9 protein [Chitinophaga terrae (ex Kim and Jung 2007)]SEA30399.1 ADP-heptose:LPS heptosyltransferase [Chitinophaga terrae (ex Kim and Jung 2007)]